MTKILAIYDNHRTQQFHFGYVPKRTESRVLDRCSTPMIDLAEMQILIEQMESEILNF